MTYMCLVSLNLKIDGWGRCFWVFILNWASLNCQSNFKKFKSPLIYLWFISNIYFHDVIFMMCLNLLIFICILIPKYLRCMQYFYCLIEFIDKSDLSSFRGERWTYIENRGKGLCFYSGSVAFEIKYNMYETI